MGRTTKPRFTQPKGGAALSILVRTGGSQSRVERITEDGVVVICLSTSGTDSDQINTALKALLESVLGVKRSQLEIVAGEMSAQKLVAVLGQDPEKVDEALKKALKAG